MILDHIENASVYYGFGERIAEALGFLQSADLPTLQIGRHDIRGEDLYAVVSYRENTKPERETLEAHRRYIDIQYVTLGEERMKVSPLGLLTPVGDYNEDDDYRLYEGSGDVITVRQGMFVLFAPQDAHLPGLPGCWEGDVRKVVVKVRI